jgi:hypothetical protein
MWRKLAVAGLTVLIAVLSLDDGQATEQKRQDQNRGQQGRDRQDRVDGPETVRSIRLRNDFDNRQVRIESVVLATDRSFYGALTSAGVERDSADKLPLDDLPIIGGLFSSKVPGNLTLEQEVGRAYSNGTTLVITIWPTVEGSDVHLELLPKDIEALNESLRALINSSQPPATGISIPGSAGGGGSVESLLVVNEASVYELPRTSFQDMGVIEEGQTVMIGGLESQIEFDKSGIPLLGRVPVLGYLFQGKAYKKETELIVIVTPSIIRPEE